MDKGKSTLSKYTNSLISDGSSISKANPQNESNQIRQSTLTIYTNKLMPDSSSISKANPQNEKGLNPNTCCLDSICCDCVKKPYRFITALLHVFTPFIAFTNIIFDIIYIKTHQQVLRYTDVYTIYLLCFFVTPVIGELCMLAILIKYQDQREEWLKWILLSPIYAWLDIFVCISKARMSQKIGYIVLTLQYFGCVGSIVQFLIQFYIIGYTNDWNVFLIAKVVILIFQIISRALDCCEHMCCCNIQQKRQRLRQYLKEDLACLGDKLSCLLGNI